MIFIFFLAFKSLLGTISEFDHDITFCEKALNSSPFLILHRDCHWLVARILYHFNLIVVAAISTVLNRRLLKLRLLFWMGLLFLEHSQLSGWKSQSERLWQTIHYL